MKVSETAESEHTATPPPCGQAQRRSLSSSQIFATTIFGFGIVYYWSAMTSVLLPEKILQFVPEESKGTALGLITAVGSIVLIVLEPVAGVMSDRSRTRWGKRVPYIVGGTAGMSVVLLLMFLAPSYAWMFVAFLVLKIFWAFAEGTYPALIPDMVPAHQRGSASGWLGVQQLLGATAGAFVSGKLVGNAASLPFDPLVAGALAMAVVLIACAAYTMLNVREPWVPPAPRAQRNIWAEAFELRPLLKQRALLWLTLSRTAWYFGFVTVQALLLFYVRDELKIEGYANATANLFSALFVAALPTVFLAGWWSDRVGRRKPFIYCSSVLMIIAAVAFLFMHTYGQAAVAMAVWGVGGGIFISTSMAMATESFPEVGANARYLALWMVISQSLPWLVAPPIAGVILDRFGFTWVFAFVALCFVAGLAIFYPVKETGPGPRSGRHTQEVDHARP